MGGLCKSISNAFSGGGGNTSSNNNSGGGGNNNNNTQTNQDRINEIYASSDKPWETNGAELNALVNDRSGTYTGGATTTPSNNNNNNNNNNSGTQLSASAAAKVGTVAQDEKGDWYAVVQSPNSNALGRDYSIDPKDNSQGPTFGANVSDNVETLFPDEVEAAGGSSEFQGSITDIFTDTDVDSAGFDAATNTYTYTPAATQTFDEAFAENRAAGNETFTFNGKLYTTELAAEPPVAQPGDLAIPEVTTTTLDGTPVLTVDEINALATEAIDAAPDYTFTPTGGPGTFAPGALPAAPIESVIATGGPGTFTPGALPAGDVDALDPRGDQIVSPTGTGTGITSTVSPSVGANDTTEALLNLTAGIGAGNVGLDEAIATLNLIEGNTLTDDDITALMPPTGGGETVGGFTEAGLADEVAKYTGSAATDSDSDSEPGALYQNIIGYGEVDTPGEKLGQFINDLGASAGSGFLTGPVAQGLQGLGLYADEVIENVTGAFSPTGPNAPQLGYDPILSNQGFGPGQVDPALAKAAAAIRDQNAAKAAAANQVTTVSDFLAPAVSTITGYGDQVGDLMSPQMQERVEKYATADPNTTFKDIFTGNVKSVSGEAITTDIPALIVRGGEDLYDVVGDVLLGGLAKKGLGLVFASSAAEGAASSNTEAQNRISQAISDGTVDVQALADKKYGGDTALAEQAMRDAATEISLVTAGPIAGAGDAALALGLGYTGIPGVLGKAPAVVQAPFKLGGAGISGGLTEGGEQVGTNLAFNVGTGLNTDLSMGVPAQMVQGTIGQGVSSTPNVASSLDMGKTVDPNTFVPTGATVGQPAQSPPGVQSAYKEAAESMAEAGISNVGDVSGATAMEAMAAQEIINDLVATTGNVDKKIIDNLVAETGLSEVEIGQMIANAGVRKVGSETIPVDIPAAPTSNALIDEVTGIGGGSNIQVIPNADGTTTLINNNTGAQAEVDVNDDLDNAIQVFDETTTAIDDQTTTLREEAATEGTNLGTGTDTDTDTDVAEVVEVADNITAEPETEVTAEPETEVTAEPETEVTAEPETEVTAEPETLENTEVEVEVETKPEVETDTTTDVDTTTLITTDQPPEDDEEVVEVEEEDVEEPMDVLVPPITTTDKDGNTITECPEGYTTIETADGPMCQKTVSSARQRAGIDSKQYIQYLENKKNRGMAGNVGRASPGQRRKTVTSTRRVRPTTRSA